MPELGQATRSWTGSFEQLLVSPLTSTEILIGKALAALAIAMTLGVVVLLIAIFGLGIPMEGSIVMLVAAMIVFLLSIIGIGLFVSALADTQQQAIIGAFMFLSPARNTVCRTETKYRAGIA